jgi:hypothetical protein
MLKKRKEPVMAGYCAPTPEVRLLYSLQTQAVEARMPAY